MTQDQTLLNTLSSLLYQGHTYTLHLGCDSCSGDLANSSFYSTFLPGTRPKSPPGTKGNFSSESSRLFVKYKPWDFFPAPINPSQSPKSLLTQPVSHLGPACREHPHLPHRSFKMLAASESPRAINSPQIFPGSLTRLDTKSGQPLLLFSRIPLSEP